MVAGSLQGQLNDRPRCNDVLNRGTQGAHTAWQQARDVNETVKADSSCKIR